MFFKIKKSAIDTEKAQAIDSLKEFNKKRKKRKEKSLLLLSR